MPTPFGPFYGIDSPVLRRTLSEQTASSQCRHPRL